MPQKTHSISLQSGYNLHWYRIESILGHGGFGITYLAHDPNLDQDVAIKEYLVTGIATRAPDSSIEPLTEDHQDQYKWGLERFISEGKTLARFDHPSLVRVYSVFETNNTAYMVMRYEQGQSLEALLKRQEPLDEKFLIEIMLKLMDGLAQVHESGFIHRDIKPGETIVVSGCVC